MNVNFELGDALFMRGILKDQLNYHNEMLDYWKERCGWPDMDLVRGMMYAVNASTHVREISYLGETLENWS